MEIYCKLKHVVSRNYDDLTIVYNLLTRNMIILTGVASDIWSFIYSDNSSIHFSVLIKHIGQLYNMSTNEIEHDINEFINELYQNNFIEINSTSYHTATTFLDDENDSIDIESEVIQLMQKRDQIYSATFELTYNCNEKCIHCYVSYPDETTHKNTLKLDKYKEIIDELYEMKCFHITFTGGEPFMFNEFIDLFKYARSKNFVCDIYTNGQAISDNHQLLDEIVPLLPKTFYISLYGSTSEVHDSITQIPGSFYKTISAIKLLRMNNISVVLNVMIMKPNHHQIDNIIKLANELNVEYRIGLSIINKNNGDTTPSNYFIDDKKTLKKILSVMNQKIYSMDAAVPAKRTSDFICGAGTTALCISPDGEVYPCVSLKTSLGSVFTNTLSEIWKSTERKKLVTSLVWANTSECKTCDFLSECPHCPGISQAECQNALSCNFCDHLIAECSYELKHTSNFRIKE